MGTLLVSVYVLTLILHISRGVTGDIIRCYCNGSRCKDKGYVCTSRVGRCFSRLTSEGDASKSVHGCVESLPGEDRPICEGGEGDLIRTRNGPNQEWPILMCCKADMCNYIDTIDINIFVNTKSNATGSNTDPSQHRPGSNPRRDNYGYMDEISQRDLWFKAAVIAVPIAGGFILVLLVLLAIRMLRNDGRRHRQLMQMRRHHSMTKAQLYVADHFLPADSKNHRLIDTNCGDKANPIYKDVNIKVDYGGQGYEKISDSSGPPAEAPCNSVVVWGKPCKNTDVAPV